MGGGGPWGGGLLTTQKKRGGFIVGAENFLWGAWEGFCLLGGRTYMNVLGGDRLSSLYRGGRVLACTGEKKKTCLPNRVGKRAA